MKIRKIVHLSFLTLVLGVVSVSLGGLEAGATKKEGKSGGQHQHGGKHDGGKHHQGGKHHHGGKHHGKGHLGEHAPHSGGHVPHHDPHQSGSAHTPDNNVDNEITADV
ncbi:MAG TPA: hypothetical protein PLY23_09060 [Alphaproteobacteria bacterium]|nr:hypothetical protein [Alphaproteobacteria bacterium]HQS94762.1 hypothetical protein [Alphaproteobacteria bacterium]